jgi:hypothetical protein
MNNLQNANVSDLADTCFLIETLLKNPLSRESRRQLEVFRSDITKEFEQALCRDESYADDKAA